jgi:hypothetical protein
LGRGLGRTAHRRSGTADAKRLARASGISWEGTPVSAISRREDAHTHRVDIVALYVTAKADLATEILERHQH